MSSILNLQLRKARLQTEIDNLKQTGTRCQAQLNFISSELTKKTGAMEEIDSQIKEIEDNENKPEPGEGGENPAN